MNKLFHKKNTLSQKACAVRVTQRVSSTLGRSVGGKRVTLSYSRCEGQTSLLNFVDKNAKFIDVTRLGEEPADRPRVQKTHRRNHIKVSTLQINYCGAEHAQNTDRCLDLQDRGAAVTAHCGGSPWKPSFALRDLNFARRRTRMSWVGINM